MSIKKQIKKMRESVTLGYNKSEKTYVISNHSKTTIFENKSLKKAIKDYKNHMSLEYKNLETVDKNDSKEVKKKSTKKILTRRTFWIYIV